jgi:hypothetical protein
MGYDENAVFIPGVPDPDRSEPIVQLWVDDCRQPSGWWQGVSAAYDWARTYEAATTALSSGKYSYASLDFDLSDTDPRHSGTDVARWIAQEAEAGRLPRLVCSIHSMHPDAGRNMGSFLRAAEESWKARKG